MSFTLHIDLHDFGMRPTKGVIFEVGTAARSGDTEPGDQAGRPGGMITVPKPYPQEFRDDVVRVAHAREAGITLTQIAKDFGVHEMTLNTWMRQADIDERARH